MLTWLVAAVCAVAVVVVERGVGDDGRRVVEALPRRRAGAGDGDVERGLVGVDAGHGRRSACERERSREESDWEHAEDDEGGQPENINECTGRTRDSDLSFQHIYPMVSLLRTLRSIRRVGLREWYRQMWYIGDAKSGRLVGTDQCVLHVLALPLVAHHARSFGNRYYENTNGEEEVPGTS